MIKWIHLGHQCDEWIHLCVHTLHLGDFLLTNSFSHSYFYIRRQMRLSLARPLIFLESWRLIVVSHLLRLSSIYFNHSLIGKPLMLPNTHMKVGIKWSVDIQMDLTCVNEENFHLITHWNINSHCYLSPSLLLNVLVCIFVLLFIFKWICGAQRGARANGHHHFIWKLM